MSRKSIKQISQPHAKEKTPNKQKSGIYKIQCNDCDKVYIGQTRRIIKQRGIEHRRDAVNREVEKSAMVRHFCDAEHDIDFNPKLVKGTQKNCTLNILESIEIFKNKDNIMYKDLECLENRLLQTIPKNKVRGK